LAVVLRGWARSASGDTAEGISWIELGLMENIYMEEIVKQKIYEFCLFAAPLKIKGGTASPIRLLALI
jgi:hypothetical protein